ncbi:MAG: helix-turn-helix transcriptional regulator [Oscillospiraceae bacterium]|jgi:transcriptional regulator with XRE-family HTH domain|nr:helix-turn-helix transcriptional regulator [Oscillospiraceae bacterium]MCX4255913.1 helix-turn-helix transcriptional regulator [Oscillospiraceae bacterium]
MIYGLPERLREMREKYNISQEAVAERLGITSSSVSSYERGERTPSLPIILKLSYIYNCSVDYLLGKNNDDNTHVYIDVTELSEKKRKAVNDFVNAIK